MTTEPTPSEPLRLTADEQSAGYEAYQRVIRIGKYLGAPVVFDSHSELGEIIAKHTRWGNRTAKDWEGVHMVFSRVK